jgi:hypothetical protein
MVYVQKIKIVMWNVLFLASKFVFLHTSHNTSIYFCGHVAHEDVRVDFSIQFF